jgi:hypothetical protein
MDTPFTEIIDDTTALKTCRDETVNFTLSAPMTRPHPHLLEISAWPWLTKLSTMAGRTVTLGSVPAEAWDAIARQGFDVVYLMGIWERSAIGRQIARSHSGLMHEYDRALPGWTPDDVPGSPYCIANYVPDVRMGGWEGLDRARAALHSRGLRLFVDFVPNHTGFDHPWIGRHPEWYVRGTEEDLAAAPDAFRRVGGSIIACGRDPHFPAWTDVAQLDHASPDVREALIDVLRLIAQRADGVRCDMAMLLLNDVFERTWGRVLGDARETPAREFWPDATSAVPSLVYLAEVYWDLEWRLQQQGFDFTYDKRLLDRLHEGSAPSVRAHLMADITYQHCLARFLENHDEARSSVAFGHRTVAAATTLMTLPGMRFVFDGQMDGATRFAPVQLGRWSEELPDQATRRLYDSLLEVTHAPLFHEGEWRLLDVERAGDDTHQRLVAWRWRRHDDYAMVVVNPTEAAAHGHIRVEELPIRGDHTFEDRLTGERYLWPRSALEAAGLYVRLPSGGAHCFLAR